MLDPIKVAEALDYNPETGSMTWKTRPRSHFSTDRGFNIFNSSYAGSPAGVIGNHGYLQIHIFGKIYLAHRLIMLIKNSAFPEGDVDHINGDRSDNRLCNLRLVTRQQNLKNRSLPSTNKSGVNGVHWRKNRGCWEAKIRINGKCMYIGSFKDIEAASLARRIFARVCYYSERHG